MACHCGDPTNVTCEHTEQQEKAPRSYAGPDGKAPPYLPQPTDFIAKPTRDKNEVISTTFGPWATGRPIWSPTADLVGVRPIVDRYTITKYGPRDWRRGNMAVMDSVGDAAGLKDSVKCTLETVSAKSDKQQNDNSIRLQQRLHEVRTYQSQIEALVLDIREEIVLLTETKIKLKFALPSLMMPESIAGECIDKRTCRVDPDLVKDEVEEELVKEMAMIHNLRQLISQLLESVEDQILSNRACKDELERNWSDKKETTEMEASNACLRNTSPNIFFKHGSSRYQHLQTTPETWQHYCESIIKLGKEQVNKSRDLRGRLDSDVILGPLRDLKNQADKVLNLLKKRIDETDQCRQAFEIQLQNILTQIAETESLYEGLSKLLRQLDYNLKVAQTRLDTRMHRPRQENCRDEVQYGLFDEVKEINHSQAALRKRVEDIDLTLAKLYQTRANLEFQIMTKRKSLYIDQQRCLAFRERYPDLSTMTGSTA